MPPIRVGIIGLSAGAKTSWASTAHLPYLQTSRGKYAIVALCNSSVSAAQSAIKAYGLPDSTKAYGDPKDLASDTEVDLVVCNTRVDIHYETIKPSLLLGKDVYCEWPLASNLAAAQELASIASQKGSKTMIGLQGQISPVILKVKDLIEQQQRIGKVLSSSIIAFGGTRTRDSLIEGLKYFTKKDVGGNIVTIGFAHKLVLGELSSFNSQLSIQRPRIPIKDSKGEVIETVNTDVADHIMLQGTTIRGTPLSVVYRRGPAFKGTPGFTWFVHGQKGEIRLTASGAALQAMDEDSTITLHDFESDNVEAIQWDGNYHDLPAPARNVAAMYEAFADKRTQAYPNFDHAVLRRKQIGEVFKSSEEQRKGCYL